MLTMGHYLKLLILLFAGHLLVTGVVGQLEELVLGGNYGSSLNNVPNLHELRRHNEHEGDSDNSQSNEGEGSLDNYKSLLSGSEFDEEGGENGMSSDSKLSKILELYTRNNQKLLRKIANLTKYLEENKPSPDVTCQTSCQSVPIPHQLCYLRCIVHTKGKDKHLRILTDFVAETASIFCKPLKTKINQIFITSEGREKLSTYKTFLSAVDIQDGPALKKARTILTYAIIGAIVGDPKTPYSPLKPVISIIDEALQKKFPGASYGIQENPNCAEVSMIDAYDLLHLAMEKEVSLQNMFLPGLILANSVSKYISARSSFRMTLIMELKRLATRISSGFACRHPETPPDLCDELGVGLILGFPIPPIANLTYEYMAGFDPICDASDDAVIKLDLDEGVSKLSKNKKRSSKF